MATDEPDAAGHVVIFSNLGPFKTDKYDSRSYAKLAVAGTSAVGVPETWVAINFIPKRDVQARVLLAAITYNSGAKLVNLGLYTDSRGEVGRPIPGAQGSTTDIPDSGECCQLARVTLPEPIALSAGKRYWLVGSPDNVNAPDFSGNWQFSNQGSLAVGPGQWVTAAGAWPAAEVRGTPAINSLDADPSPAARNSTNRATIFSNLGPLQASHRFNQYSAGAGIAGPDGGGGSEKWIGLPFVPQRDSHAKRLAAAIQHFSGGMKINLGIYSDNNGTVGTLLPNGQASTTVIPTYPSCCDLTEVVLPDEGVALSAQTRYWLVASTDDVTTPDFYGFWMNSNFYSNYQQPEFFFWTYIPSNWLAAEIKGTMP